MQPIATTIVGDIYTPVERARMQGYVSGMFGVAAIIGPTLGAFVVEHISWSLVFWVNIPVGIATCVMFGLFLWDLPEARRGGACRGSLAARAQELNRHCRLRGFFGSRVFGLIGAGSPRRPAPACPS